MSVLSMTIIVFSLLFSAFIFGYTESKIEISIVAEKHCAKIAEHNFYGEFDSYEHCLIQLTR